MGVCGQGLSVPVIFEDRTMDTQRYIDEVLPIALECSNNMLGNKWTYQQAAKSQTHHLSQKWCADHWPPNSLVSCPLDYSLGNELDGAMNWKQITTNATLIEEIKHAVERIEK